MGIKSLEQMAVNLAILATSTAKLPLILKEVRKAQLVLLEESKASRLVDSALTQHRKFPKFLRDVQQKKD